MKKKGQTTYVLVIIAGLAIYIAALFVMISFTNNLNADSAELSQLSYELKFNHEYVKAQAELIANQTKDDCQGCNPAQLKQKFLEVSTEKEQLFRYEGAGNFYGKIRNGEFKIESNKIIIEELFVESQVGENKKRKSFNLAISL